MIIEIDFRNIKSLSWYFDSTCSQHLTFERNIFICHLVESSTKIECANRNYFLAKGIRKIRLLCLKKMALHYQ